MTNSVCSEVVGCHRAYAHKHHGRGRPVTRVDEAPLATSMSEIEEYKDAFGHTVRFRGVERHSYDHVQCVLFVSIPVPDQPGEFYDWKAGEVTTWPAARKAQMEALNDGCQAFYFALPDQLVGGVPVDTRLR